MRNLRAEKVLRVNCPGFGTAAGLLLDEAKPLALYDAVVINPVSIIHLFQPKSAIAERIEVLLAEGLNSLDLPDDRELDSICGELEIRERELEQFLEKGGLLIYFLVPPFTVNGPSITLDNYQWLGNWMPAPFGSGKTKSIGANISGKGINLSLEARSHFLANYLQKEDLEWRTTIKVENLNQGYEQLAGTGHGRCISGYRKSGNHGGDGQVVFLPAPYDVASDDLLSEGIRKWHESRKISEPILTPVKKGPESPIATIESVIDNVGCEAQYLMERLEQETEPSVASWCSDVSFSELEKLHSEIADLNRQIEIAKNKIVDRENLTRNLSITKDVLLSASGKELVLSCSRVFELLGWTVQPSGGADSTLWLSDGNKTQAIVKVLYATAQPGRADLAELAESVINYWGKYDVEPKGVLVASTFAATPPNKRQEEDFPAPIDDFAKRKNLCLSTTSQLLCIYRDLLVNNTNAKKIREDILGACGVLTGFRLELSIKSKC